MKTLRIGLFGTGPWATGTQGPALVAHPGVDLVGVWGRDLAKADALAAQLNTRAYREVDALIADVDAVAVALPPYVQAPIARAAAQAGRHLLLDKPVALEVAEADALAADVDTAGVASVVFFTSRFQPQIAAFLAGVGEVAWFGGRSTFHASVFQTGSPFGASPWRRERGGLWDLGPHALSVLLPALGPVERVSAEHGPHQSTVVLMRHARGAVSTMSLTLDAPPAAELLGTTLYGPDGEVTLPGWELSPVAAFGRAIDELLAAVAAGPGGADTGAAAGSGGAGAGLAAGSGGAADPAAVAGTSGTVQPCDVRFGLEVVAILAAADAARTSGTVEPVSGSTVTGVAAAG